jgi:hypothetical protein
MRGAIPTLPHGAGMTGRPSSYTEKKADVICDRLSAGESLVAICADKDQPSTVTVFKWLAKHEMFLRKYARAREAQADVLFDEILGIADETSLDTIKGKNGEAIPDNEWISRSRLRIDARKWMAGKLRPKVYGDKIELEHSGDVGLRPIVMGERPAE